MYWKSTGLSLLVVVGLFFMAKSFGAKALEDRKTWPVEEEYVLLPPPQAARFTSLGYNELAADTTWVRALVYYGSQIKGDENYRYLEKFIDNIIALDPQFKRAFTWAVSAVTYKNGQGTQEEFRIAANYYEKAIKVYPEDWEFAWRGGLLYWFDVWDEDPTKNAQFKERGAELMERATRSPGAPDHLAGKATTMRTKLGQKERALDLLKERLFTTDDPKARENIMRRFRTISDDGSGDELQSVNERFNQLRSESFDLAPADFFVLLGTKPRTSIKFDALANARNLIGSQDEGVELFPWQHAGLSDMDSFVPKLPPVIDPPSTVLEEGEPEPK